MMSPSKTLADYELLEFPTEGFAIEIGSEAYSSVRKARDRQTNDIHVLQVISKKAVLEFDIKEKVETEIMMKKSICHPNILKLSNCFEDDESVYLVYEYAENGTLFQTIKRENKLSEEKAFIFFLQTCFAVDFLHSREILHTDLKPENLLLDKDSNIKINEIGGKPEGTFCGTVDYLAPEAITNQPLDQNRDIWCLGVLLYEMVHGEAPFKGRSDCDKLNKIIKNTPIDFSPEISSELIDLISKILKPIPSERISIEEILSHPWMQKYDKVYGINIPTLKEQQDELIRVFRELQVQESTEEEGTDKNDESLLEEVYCYKSPRAFAKKNKLYLDDDYYDSYTPKSRSTKDTNSVIETPRSKDVEEKSFLDTLLMGFGCLAR